MLLYSSLTNCERRLMIELCPWRDPRCGRAALKFVDTVSQGPGLGVSAVQGWATVNAVEHVRCITAVESAQPADNHLKTICSIDRQLQWYVKLVHHGRPGLGNTPVIYMSVLFPGNMDCT